MKLRNTCVFAGMMGVALAASGVTVTTTTGDSASGTANTVTSTQITQTDHAITDAVQTILRDGAYTGVTATVSATSVTLRGSVKEDKLQLLVDSISKINNVSAVNIDGLVTTKLMPSTPNEPIDKPSPAAGLIAPPPAGSAAQ